jgi:hypothetical protein
MLNHFVDLFPGGSATVLVTSADLITKKAAQLFLQQKAPPTAADGAPEGYSIAAARARQTDRFAKRYVRSQ